MVQLNFVDPTGDGTSYPTPYPTDLKTTVYNGSKGCNACGVLINPVAALQSDLCQPCSRRKASNQLSSRMAEG